jgi:hypothetical protein
MSNNQLIAKSHVKRKVHALGRRATPGFIDGLNDHVHYIIERCAKQHNGGRITLDRELLAILFPTKY